MISTAQECSSACITAVDVATERTVSGCSFTLALCVGMLCGSGSGSTACNIRGIPSSSTLLLAFFLFDWGLEFPFFKMELLPACIFLALD